MAATSSTSAWLREHGWWLPHGAAARPTHLLLDGGKARVPDESAGAFLSAYAIAVVRGLYPCVVELRTPVFKLFLDLDVKTAEGNDLHFEAVMAALQTRAAAFFAVDQPRAIVCLTPPRVADGAVKAGRHVVWTNILATSATALAFREAVVDDLEAALPGACLKPWATVVDACVFRANGLRMPFSAKGRDNPATYTPAEVWVGDAATEVGACSGVSAVRQWVRELSIRTVGEDETPVREGVVLPAAEGESESLCGTTQSLRGYSAALALLDAVLPVQYAGQRFTGVIKADNCFILRSSSRYCENAGRAHNTCNIYFVLTPKGIRQKCYCRCDTTEGRKYGLCRDFGGEVHPVADDALAAFFGEAFMVPPPALAAAAAAAVAACRPLPSAKTDANASVEDLLNRRPRPQPARPSRKQRCR